MDNQQLKTAPNQKYFVEANKIYGNYKTLDQIQVQTKKCLETKWRCLHIPTNEIRIRKACDLAKFITGEEQEKIMSDLVANDQHQQGYRHSLYNYYKKNAIRRKHSFDLEYNDFINIIKQPCAYCGELPFDHNTTKCNSKQPPFLHQGIDRVNPNEGYSVKNCVPCCSKCNYMKHILTKDEFVNHIIKIYNHLGLSSTTISKESTLQANGDGNGKPLTDNAEGEDIVSTL